MFYTWTRPRNFLPLLALLIFAIVVISHWRSIADTGRFIKNLTSEDPSAPSDVPSWNSKKS